MSDAVPGEPEQAAARYKEIVAIATDAVDRVHAHERDQAAGLEEELAEGRERIAEAQRQEEQVVEGVRVRWKAAMEALWEERWMRVTRMPAPDASAPPAGAEESVRSVQNAYLELHDALGRSSWSVSSWIPGVRRGRRDE